VALLRDEGSEREAPLPARCLIGRSRACDLQISSRNVSSRHASVEWVDGAWVLQDLGSRNGTFVGDAKVKVGERVVLREGLRVRFGRSAEPWVVVDVDAPELMAIHTVSGAIRRAEGGCLLLPDADSPQRCIYQDSAGRWLAEADGEAVEVEDRAILALGDDALWRLHLPLAGTATLQDSAALLLVSRLRLRFAHSRDEEYVELVATCDERRLDLKARAHHYPLLVLARLRLADLDAGKAPAERGWVHQDELLRMLHMDDNHLNISIYRARAQLAKLGVVDAAALIERRTGTRQLRLGVERIEVVTLERGR
jgi:hypothetical protein